MTARRPLATAPEVSEYLNVPVDTLRKWRLVKRGPKWIPIGRHVRYRWADVDAWLESQTQSGAVA